MKSKDTQKNNQLEPLLTIDTLAVDFNTPQGVLHAVRDVSLKVYARQLLAIVGESGSGKSVTAHSILKLLPHNAAICNGSITFDTKELTTSTQEEMYAIRGREIALIFQEPSRSFDPLYPIHKVFRETILTHIPKATPEEITTRTLTALKEVQIPNPENRMRNYPHQFSGGQLQRINIALALVCNPRILIADEPTTALDVTTQAEIIMLIKKLQAQRNLAIIFISHDIELVGQIADSIAIMYAGRIMEYGECTTILGSPHHPYTAALLRSTITMGQHYRRSSLQSIKGEIPDPYHHDAGCPFAPRCELAQNICRTDIPAMQNEKTKYRCVIPGKK